jgi:hypothetical protein
METEYDCAGICTLPDFFLFSDVGKGTPLKLCKDVSVSEVHKNIWKYAYICFAASGLGLIGLTMAITICLFNGAKPKYTWEKYKSMTS